MNIMNKVIHHNQIDAIEDSLRTIFQEGKYADQVIESTLKRNHKWGSHDRRFIAETTYDIVRWWRWIISCGEIQDGDEKKFLKAIRTWLILQNSDLPSWLADGISSENILENIQMFESTRAIRESIPDWLDELGEKEL